MRRVEEAHHRLDDDDDKKCVLFLIPSSSVSSFGSGRHDPSTRSQRAALSSVNGILKRGKALVAVAVSGGAGSVPKSTRNSIDTPNSKGSCATRTSTRG